MSVGRGARASFIVKVRERVRWTTRTVKGPRRVERWGPWERRRGPHEYATLHAAYESLAATGSRFAAPYAEVAVFLRGRRVEHRASQCVDCLRLYGYAQADANL